MSNQHASHSSSSHGHSHGNSGHGGDGHHSFAHVSSPAMLLGVFGILMVLTVLTVMATKIDLGPWNFILAMIVATIKAGLVAFYFMHLRYDWGFNRIIFFGSFMFLALFLSVTMLDSHQYQSTIEWQEKVLTQDAK